MYVSHVDDERWTRWKAQNDNDDEICVGKAEKRADFSPLLALSKLKTRWMKIIESEKKRGNKVFCVLLWKSIILFILLLEFFNTIYMLYRKMDVRSCVRFITLSRFVICNAMYLLFRNTKTILSPVRVW